MKTEFLKTGFRPVIDRIVFLLVLLGVLTTVHLWIQQNRGFDRGCLGVAMSDSIEENFDCKSVLLSDAGTFMGIPNTVSGHIFYDLLVLLSLAIIFVEAGKVALLKNIRSVLILGGFGYTCYLVYFQYFVLGEFCALCLISAAVVTLLLITQILDRLLTGQIHSSRTKSIHLKNELIMTLTLLALTVFLSAADVHYFRGLDILEKNKTDQAGSDLNHGSEPNTGDTTATNGKDNPETTIGIKPIEKADCEYHQTLEPVEEWELQISPRDPFKGNPNASVVVFEYFDPNCPHCKKLHDIIGSVEVKYRSKVQFIYKPFPLWSYSIPQIQALYLAEDAHKFFEMLDRQFELQQHGKGLSNEQLGEIADEIGMDGNHLIKQLQNKQYANLVLAQRKAARSIGIRSAPVVMINGKFIASNSRTDACISQFIEDVLK